MTTRIIFLLPYLACLALSLGVLAYTWKRRHVKGAANYAAYILSHNLWTGGFILELLNPSLDAKVFWDGLQWIFGSAVVLSFLLFTINYTGQEVRKPRRFWTLLATIPAIFIILLITNPYHHLVYADPYLQPEQGYPALLYTFTPVMLFYGAYCLSIAAVAVVPILRGLQSPHQLYRYQILTILLGFLLPFVGSALTLAGI